MENSGKVRECPTNRDQDDGESRRRSIHRNKVNLLPVVQALLRVCLCYQMVRTFPSTYFGQRGRAFWRREGMRLIEGCVCVCVCRCYAFVLNVSDARRRSCERAASYVCRSCDR